MKPALQEQTATVHGSNIESRSMYGVASLPLGVPVELEVIFEVAG